MAKGKPNKQHRTRAQHYVPRFYLSGFTNPKGKLSCYDKAGDKVYTTSPAEAAQETDFYEIKPGTTKETVPVNMVENRLAIIERHYAPLIGKLIKAADTGKMTIDQLEEIAPFVAVQWLRTKAVRDMTHYMIERAYQTLCDDLIKLNFPGKNAKVRATYPKEAMAAFHAEQMFDGKTIMEIAIRLVQHIWVIGINRTNHLFYTSDHPVCRRANCEFDGRPGTGFRDPGVEVVFPLDSHHVLLIMERNHFRAWRPYDAKTRDLTEAQVADYNRLQVRNSGQRLYCAEDDFDDARGLCAQEPELRDPNRPRAIVGSTPFFRDGDELKNYTYVITT